MITEKRAFYAALAKARKEGVKEFEFHGKTFKVFERFMNFQEFVTEQLNESQKHKDLEWLKLPADDNAIDQFLTLATTGECSMPTEYQYHDPFNELKKKGKITIKDGLAIAIDKKDPIWKLIWSELRTTRGQMNYMK